MDCSFEIMGAMNMSLPAYRLRPDEALPCRPPPASPATSPPEAINLDFLPVSDAGLVGHS